MSITIFTSAQVIIGRTARGTSSVKVLFNNLPGTSLGRYDVAEPYELETDGAIIETFGPRGTTTLEIIDFVELKKRFPNVTGSHLCILTGVGTDNEKCENRNCSGRCKMHSWPKYCTCEVT
jgi:hypothetical protein